MSKDRCPKCGSNNLEVGNFPLNCLSCGWCYLNSSPCYVCGKPSFNSAGVNHVVLHGCKDHPATLEACRQMIQQERAD